jgi:hypothetical protein
MKNLLLVSSLALGLAASAFADSFTLSSVNGGAAFGSPKLNLDGLLLGNSAQAADATLTVSFTGSGAVVQGAENAVYAAPFVSGSNGLGFGSPNQPGGADTTRYLSTGIGSVVLEFSSSQTYFGLLWGSVDNYNTLSFYSGGNLVGAFNGLDVWASANGNQGEQGTFYVNFTDLNGSFDKIVASSTQYAFEFDNIAYNTGNGVPDTGATVAMLGLAFAGMAALRRRL